MDEINNEKEVLETIINARIDARYLLDNKYPIKGIYKVLGIWLISYILTSVTLYIFSKFIMSNTTETLFQYTRILNIILFSITIFIYFIATLQIKMTVKEKDFLKGFSCFIIVFSLLRMLIPISYYMNSAFLLQIYESIPFDMVILILAFVSLYSYSHQRQLIYIIVLNIMYLVFYVFSTSFFINNPEPSNLSILVQELNTVFRNEGFMIILLFLITLIVFAVHIQNEGDGKHA